MTTHKDCGSAPEPERLRLPGMTSQELMQAHIAIPCPVTLGGVCKCQMTDINAEYERMIKQ